MRRGAAVVRGGVGLLLVFWFTAPFVPLLLWAGAEAWPGSAPVPDRWSPAAFLDSWGAEARAALGRSMLLGTAVALLATPAGAVAARALGRGTVRHPRTVAAVLLAPVALPLFAVVTGLNVVLLRLRVPAPAAVVLVLVVAALPYTTYVMRVAYASYEFTYEDEARTLGASATAVAWRVRLPLLAPALASAAFLAFLVGWSDYIVTLVVGGGRLVTVPILVASAASGTGNEPTVGALALGALLPPSLALIAAALARHRLTGPAPDRRRSAAPVGTALSSQEGAA